MAKTYVDELVEYPAKVMQEIGKSAEVVALILNKSVDEISDDEFDEAFDNYIFNYEYVDSTITESAAYVWVEAEVASVSNWQVKGMKLYVTVACHKRYMKVGNTVISGLVGNRRDNLVRYIDKILNGSDIFGIGKLKLNSIQTMSSSNTEFTMREICYVVPDFNLKDDIE